MFICGELICDPRPIVGLLVVVKIPRYEILSIHWSFCDCWWWVWCCIWGDCMLELCSFWMFCWWPWWGYMFKLLALLVSSLIIDDGLQRSSFNGLQMLWDGLDCDCGSNDKSSESIEPVMNETKIKQNYNVYIEILEKRRLLIYLPLNLCKFSKTNIKSSTFKCIWYERLKLWFFRQIKRHFWIFIDQVDGRSYYPFNAFA